jgi:hypothetical protein
MEEEGDNQLEELDNNMYRDMFRKNKIRTIVKGQRPAPVPIRNYTQEQITAYKTGADSFNERKWTNPFSLITSRYLNSIRPYGEIDDNFGFDGRYFHIANLPNAIDKVQTSVLTNKIKQAMTQTANANEYYKYKYHIAGLKFLYALNRANKYLSTITKLEKLSNKQIVADINSDATYKRFMLEQSRLKASFVAPPHQMSAQTVTAINNGFNANAAEKIQMVPTQSLQEYRRLRNNIQQANLDKKTAAATKWGFPDVQSYITAKENYSKRVVRAKKIAAKEIPLIGFDVISHSNQFAAPFDPRAFRYTTLTAQDIPKLNWGYQDAAQLAARQARAHALQHQQQPVVVQQNNQQAIPVGGV